MGVANIMGAARFFHYTAGTKLQPILDTGALRPSNAGAAGEEPLLWFSTNPRWEPTATKMMTTPHGVRRLTLSQQQGLFGCLRFEIPSSLVARLLPWGDACRRAGISRDGRRALERAGTRQGADPKHWFGYSEAVPLGDCVIIERMEGGGQWVPLELGRVDGTIR